MTGSGAIRESFVPRVFRGRPCTDSSIALRNHYRRKQHVKFRNIAVISVAATIGAVALGIGGAQAAGLLGSEGIKDNSIRSIDIKDHTLRTDDMSAAALRQLQGPQGPQG